MKGETKGRNKMKCCICGKEIEGYGNNPSPVKDEGECCDSCNMRYVITARLGRLLFNERKEEKEESKNEKE